MKAWLIVTGLAVSLTAGAQQKNLGRIEFPTSGSPEAQKHFIQGVLLLHSFEYLDAREEFEIASSIQPGFAMAYWGEALTYTHPIWVEQDADAARKALSRLAPTTAARLDKAPTEREKDYLRAVETLYGDGGKISRDTAYAEAMRRMMQKYPDDLEAAALYAVALMGTCQYQRNYAVYMRAAAVAEEVYAKNPQHPGAIHYLIHAYDDPVHAPLGLRAARVYGRVAGGASHAQHMPSHIFVAMGMWDDVVSANEASVEVADQRLKSKGLSRDARNFHSLLWLEYGYLQEGRARDAHRVLDEVAASAARSKNSRVLAHLAQMWAAYAVETGEWANLTGEFDLAKAGLSSYTAALAAQGSVAIHSGRLDEAKQLLTKARARLSGSAGEASDPHHGDAMHAPAAAEAPNERKSAEIMAMQLEAEVKRAEGNRDAALNLLASAAAAEDALSFEFGPPVPVKPTRELYGEMLLEAGRAKEAKNEFERALTRCPRRTLSLRGLAKAEAALGDSAASRQTLDELKTFWRGAAL
jgi:tetratricopeptide (TPR) repeat protein